MSSISHPFTPKIESAITDYVVSGFEGFPDAMPEKATITDCLDKAKAIFNVWKEAIEATYAKENKPTFSVTIQNIYLSVTDLKNLLPIFQAVYPDYKVESQRGRRDFTTFLSNSFKHDEKGYYSSEIKLNVTVLPTHPKANPLTPPITVNAYNEDLKSRLQWLYDERAFNGDMTIQIGKKKILLHTMFFSHALLSFLKEEKAASFSPEMIELLIKWGYFTSSYTLQQEGSLREILSIYEIGASTKDDLLKTHAKQALGAKVSIPHVTVLEFAEIVRKAISLQSEGLNLIIAKLLLKTTQDKARELLNSISDEEREKINSFISVRLKNDEETHLTFGECNRLEDIFKEVHAPALKRSKTTFN